MKTIEFPSFPHRPPQFNTSVPHKDHTFSAPINNGPLSFSPTPKSLISTSRNPQFHPPLSSTPNTPQFLIKNPSAPPPQFNTKTPQCGTDVLNWGGPNLNNKISRSHLKRRKIFIPTVHRIKKSIVVEHINKRAYKWSRWLIKFEIFREQRAVIFVPSKWSTRKISLKNFK